jgi:lincosamide nucleotidyltransferase A/C/D/E
MREMSLRDVLAFLDLTDDLGIVPWLAGGWGDDAGHGEQTRWHEDLDVFIAAGDAAVFAQHLSLRGFTAQPQAPWHITFVDRRGRAIDVRLFERDGDEVTYGPDERWPGETLDGYGVLGERTVRVVRPHR